MAVGDLVFLDTAFIYALVNTRDQWHEQASRWEARLSQERRPLVTSEFVLIEVADGLAALRFRRHAESVVTTLRGSSHVEVVPLDSGLLATAWELFIQRPDKEWGLTDCTSFVIMQERGLVDALTTDEHFRQAGFRPLLVDEPVV